MATVELEALGKRYRGASGDAVREVSLRIEEGEFVTLVGPSGCGKSTTLNLLAGLERPSSGVIRIDGVDVTQLSPRERDVAMVFQSYALYPHMDVRRNLGFPLEVAGLSKAELETRVKETAELLGLGELLHRRPRELSGGQRQRVALGRALVRRPKLFLFDEPLSNLDAALRTQMRAELKQLHQRLKGTFIYVTHDQAEAMTLSDRVVVMNKGEVQQVAPPREIYERPANVFVAEFFGTPRINVVSPRVLGLEAPGPDVRAAVRPEHLSVGPVSEPAPSPTYAASRAGRVLLIEPMGAESWITLELDGERIVARASPELEVRMGDSLSVRARKDKILWFDARTGLRKGA